jgi:hypothetical protein
MFLLVCVGIWYRDSVADAGTTSSSNKLEILPSTARIIPEQYIAILATGMDVETFVAVVQTDTPMTVQYKYNHTSSTPPIRGVAVADVSNTALQWLLESDMVASITPVSTRTKYCVGSRMGSGLTPVHRSRLGLLF